MKDSIDKNLEFKLTLFAGLFGVWWWIVHFSSKFDLSKEIDLSTLSFIIISFFVFYPLINLIEMLVYIFLYQRSSVADKKLKEMYKKASNRFFSWLALLFLILPLLIVIFIFAQTEIITTIVISVLYLIIVGLFFARFFKFRDFGENYWIFSAWVTVYVLIFIFGHAIAKFFIK